MKQWWYAFWMCFGMFCGIPCPVRIWDEKARPRMISCLPLVGLVIGGFWVLIAWGTDQLGFPRFLRAALLALTPWALSGCIHLDGFLDCCDAIFSRRDLERRQEILKDPHSGSFAVIGMTLLVMVSFAVWLDAGQTLLLPLWLLPAAVRAAAAIAVMCMKPLGHSQYAHDFVRQGVPVLPIICLLACVIVPIILCGPEGLAPLVGALGFGVFVRYGAHQLGGISGDISGFALTMGELCGTIALAFLA